MTGLCLHGNDRSARRLALDKRQEKSSNTAQAGVTIVLLLSTKHFDSLIGILILILMFIL